MKTRRSQQIIAGRVAMGAGAYVQGTSDDGSWSFQRTGVGVLNVTFPWPPVAVTAASNSQGRAVSYATTAGTNVVTFTCFITSTLAADDQSISFIAVGPHAY